MSLDHKSGKLFAVNPKKPMKFTILPGKMLKIKCNSIARQIMVIEKNIMITIYEIVKYTFCFSLICQIWMVYVSCKYESKNICYRKMVV